MIITCSLPTVTFLFYKKILKNSFIKYGMGWSDVKEDCLFKLTRFKKEVKCIPVNL